MNRHCKNRQSANRSCLGITIVTLEFTTSKITTPTMVDAKFYLALADANGPEEQYTFRKPISNDRCVHLDENGRFTRAVIETSACSAESFFDRAFTFVSDAQTEDGITQAVAGVDAIVDNTISFVSSRKHSILFLNGPMDLTTHLLLHGDGLLAALLPAIDSSSTVSVYEVDGTTIYDVLSGVITPGRHEMLLRGDGPLPCEAIPFTSSADGVDFSPTTVSLSEMKPNALLTVLRTSITRPDDGHHLVITVTTPLATITIVRQAASHPATTSPTRARIGQDGSAVASCLKAVLADQTHTPYRDCLLTFVLQQAFDATKSLSLVYCIRDRASEAKESQRLLRVAFSTIQQVGLDTDLVLGPLYNSAVITRVTSPKKVVHTHRRTKRDKSPVATERRTDVISSDMRRKIASTIQDHIGQLREFVDDVEATISGDVARNEHQASIPPLERAELADLSGPMDVEGFIKKRITPLRIKPTG